MYSNKYCWNIYVKELAAEVYPDGHQWLGNKIEYSPIQSSKKLKVLNSIIIGKNSNETIICDNSMKCLTF